jgi:transcriptional regulator GlxA family with amidase domain
MMNEPRNVAILVFDDVEVLDFAGPYEVFNVAGQSSPPAFYVYAVGVNHEPVLARGRLLITPRYSIGDCPQPDVLVVPGGFGTRPLLKHGGLLAWIAGQAGKAEWILSVCTGALLLAKAGLLQGRRATTHHGAYDHLLKLSPTTAIEKGSRYVQSSSSIITAGGISAGIDASLFLVEKLAGPGAHAEVLEEMEYGWPGNQSGAR